jgi:hypothetical protein
MKMEFLLPTDAPAACAGVGHSLAAIGPPLPDGNTLLVLVGLALFVAVCGRPTRDKGPTDDL